MAVLVATIHDFTDRAKDVDGRHEGGHDEIRQPVRIASNIRQMLNRAAGGSTRAVTGKD
jgi:hypothetical protein